MKLALSYLLIVWLSESRLAEPKKNEHGGADGPESRDTTPSSPNSTSIPASPLYTYTKSAAPAAPTAHTTPTVPLDEHLSSRQCLNKKFTLRSCQKVFCPPWMRCLNGRCECKLPYQCPREGAAQVCSTQGRTYISYCQLKAVDCMRDTALFDRFVTDKACKGDFFKADLKGKQNIIEVKMDSETFLICGNDWKIEAANVACRRMPNGEKGAERATTIPYGRITDHDLLPNSCVSVDCKGFEGSLAECTFTLPKVVNKFDMIATATCYIQRDCTAAEFRCVNRKCIPLNHTCDAADDCGDGSDEMCCKKCRGGFHCKSNVCIPDSSTMDAVIDCLGGEDEASESFPVQKQHKHPNVNKEGPNLQAGTSAKNEIRVARDTIQKLVCGVTSKTQKRRKRVIGGQEAGQTQFPWQVAIQESNSIDCGATYIGGCWVLTAAHCVRPRPDAYQVKLSLWSKLKKLETTDIVPVQNIYIHHEYNPNTYQNDIALIELKKLPQSNTQCFHENAAVAPACIPWSEYQFMPGHNCSISGWGRVSESKTAAVLRWANIEIIGDCSGIYGHRFYEGMECAGSLDGSVDSCQGDSGGPLVCTDSLGVSYVWGIVSWGEKCGVAGFPGVYTKVAHYFDWIVSHIGREAISKYNV
ncbi:complement factor I [Brienomyrus brachyistius]|uniref:complement factor I n=1 Tax=Brienomyrus brachyistius TaxID=42636 RepID=UPI0020B26859|nr:complement factor I [Brienomyrus brachyistius]